MIRHQYLLRAAIALALGAGVATTGQWGLPQAHAAEQAKGDSIGAEVGGHLQAAQDLLKANKPKEAMAKIRDADAMANKSPYESFIIERMRAGAATMSGDTDTALKSFEVIIASGRLPPADRLAMIQGAAVTAYRAKDYVSAITWSQRYLKEGGTDPHTRTLLTQSYYLTKDYGNAAKVLQVAVEGTEKTGKAPPQDELELLANCYLQLQDNTGYVWALERLVGYYPKKEYWADLLSRTQRRPGFGERLALDVLRLKSVTGTMNGAADYMEMAALALQKGFPGEAKKAVEQGFSEGALGTGPDADRHKRMKELVAKESAADAKSLASGESEAAALGAHDGIGLVNLGYAYVANGDFAKGIKLMETGIRKGIEDAHAPEDAKLHLGIAYFQAGQREKAAEIFKTVTGKHGAADLGRLWGLYVRRAPG